MFSNGSSMNLFQVVQIIAAEKHEHSASLLVSLLNLNTTFYLKKNKNPNYMLSRQRTQHVALTTAGSVSIALGCPC